MPTSRPRQAPPSPRRPLGGFIHLLARFYQNYRRAILLAAKRKRNRGVDVDQQLSLDGTLWSLHWATVGKNKLHDPDGVIKPHRRIDSLHDHEIEKLRGPKDQHPHRTQHLVDLAARSKVRLELELKVFAPVDILKHVIDSDSGQFLMEHDLLQFKVRAALKNSVGMLTQAHNAGGVTIVSWEDYSGPGLPKSSWDVIDYSRGHSHWIN